MMLMPTTKTHNQKVGKWGEQRAIDELVAKGYKIIRRNVYTPYGEVDLIAQNGDGLVFIEVKTRTNDTFGQPELAVNAKKYGHFANAAAFIAQEMQASNYRLDVIAILGKPGQEPEITHFENI